MSHNPVGKQASTSPALPAVQRALAKLGADIQMGRRYRRIRQSSFAESLGVSRSTVRRLEAGDPGVSMGVLCRACLALGHLDAFQTLIEAGDREAALLSDPPPARVRRVRLRLADERPADGPPATDGWW